MEFEKEILPLKQITSIIFDIYIIIELQLMLESYKDTFLKTNSSQDKVKEIILKNIPIVLKNTSPSYLKLLKKNYFSYDGLCNFIYHDLYKLTLKYIEDL